MDTLFCKRELTPKESRWIRALLDVANILEYYNIKFFLDCGTLLGAVRDQKFIPWDNDIDIGVLDNSGDKKVFEEVARDIYDLGYATSLTKSCLRCCQKPDVEININLYCKEDAGYSSKFIKTSGARRFFAFFVFVENGEYISFCGRGIGIKVRRLLLNMRPVFSMLPVSAFERFAKIEYKKTFVPSEFFERVEKICFYGNQFPVPYSCSEYLEFRYGESWEVAEKNYNYFEDDGAIIRNE